MDKRHRELHKLAKRFGFHSPEHTRGGHMLLVHKDNGGRVIVSTSPSDHRALKNITDDLERISKGLPQHPR